MGLQNTKPVHDAPVYIPSAASVLYEPGDLLYEVAGVVRPASSQADQLTEAANQRLFAQNFVGICLGQKLAADASTDRVPTLTGPVDVEFTAASDTYTYGDLVGADEASSGTALEDQQVKKVLDRTKAIGMVVKTTAASATKVWVRTFGKFHPLIRVQDLVRFAAPQTIDMADAQVALLLTAAGAGQTQVTSNILFVDANSSATEDLLLPPEAECQGMLLVVVNTGGEDIVVKEDSDTTTIATVSTTETGLFVCDGTSWKGGVITIT